MLSDVQAWERMKSLGIEKWIAQRKKSGEIRQIGFPFHGDTDTFHYRTTSQQSPGDHDHTFLIKWE